MMKLSQLMNSSERMRKLNSKFVKILNYKEGRDKSGQAVAMAKTYTPYELNVHHRIQPSKDKNRYVSSITFIDKKLNVKVSCSCPDYMYRWEFANAQAGAADIIYGNGDEPGSTNPGNVPGLCKHLIALRSAVKQKHNI